MSEPKQLWRREALHFVVEIKVGISWVEHSRATTVDAAESEARKALKDPSVTAVRVCEHSITHICKSIFEEEDAPVLRIPPKMTPTGQKKACPLCSKLAPVATDGTNEWVFCGECDRAFPA